VISSAWAPTSISQSGRWYSFVDPTASTVFALVARPAGAAAEAGWGAVVGAEASGAAATGASAGGGLATGGGAGSAGVQALPAGQRTQPAR